MNWMRSRSETSRRGGLNFECRMSSLRRAEVAAGRPDAVLRTRLADGTIRGRSGGTPACCVPASLPGRRPRRRARAADGRAIRSETARIDVAPHHRLAAIRHAIAGRVGAACRCFGMAPAGVAGRRRAPVLRVQAARILRRGRSERKRSDHHQRQCRDECPFHRLPPMALLSHFRGSRDRQIMSAGAANGRETAFRPPSRRACWSVRISGVRRDRACVAARRICGSG